MNPRSSRIVFAIALAVDFWAAWNRGIFVWQAPKHVWEAEDVVILLLLPFLSWSLYRAHSLCQVLDAAAASGPAKESLSAFNVAKGILDSLYDWDSQHGHVLTSAELATMKLREADLRRCIEQFEVARTLAQYARKPADAAIALTETALAHFLLGEFSRAIDLEKQALDELQNVHRASGNRRLLLDLGVFSLHLGTIQRNLGDYPASHISYGQARQFLIDYGDSKLVDVSTRLLDGRTDPPEPDQSGPPDNSRTGGSRQSTQEREPARSQPCNISYELDRGRGWRTLPESLGEMLTVEHVSGRARITFSRGPYGRLEGGQRDFRAQAVRDYLRRGLLPDGSYFGRVPASRVLFIRTDLPLAGEANTVRAKYVNPQGDLAGFVSLFHGGLEYTIQWSAPSALEEDIEEIVESFRFDEGSSTGTV